MILTKRVFLIITIFFFTFVESHSNEKISYLDMEFVIKNSNIGKSMLEKINNENDKNIEIFKKKL